MTEGGQGALELGSGTPSLCLPIYVQLERIARLDPDLSPEAPTTRGDLFPCLSSPELSATNLMGELPWEHSTQHEHPV